MNSFVHLKFYTTHQTGPKTEATITYAEAIKRRTKHDDMLKLFRRTLTEQIYLTASTLKNVLLCQSITKEFACIKLKLC